MVRILRVLYVDGDATIFDLRRMLNYTDRTIFVSLRELIRRGYAKRVRRGKYRITKKGKQLVELLLES